MVPPGRPRVPSQEPPTRLLALEISLQFMDIYADGIIQDVLLCYLLSLIIIMLRFIHIIVSIVHAFLLPSSMDIYFGL